MLKAFKKSKKHKSVQDFEKRSKPYWFFKKVTLIFSITNWSLKKIPGRIISIINNNFDMGIYMTALDDGEINVGDKVEINQ